MTELSNALTIQRESFFSKALIANTLILGAAVVRGGFGTQAAVLGMVTNVALARLNPHLSTRFWFSWDKHIIRNITIAGFAIYFAFRSKPSKLPDTNQVAVVLARGAFKAGYISRVFFIMCVVSPVIEEIVFRGFLQEKIRDVQCVTSSDLKRPILPRKSISGYALSCRH